MIDIYNLKRYKEIMAGRLEEAKNYLVNIAERTIGIDAYKRYKQDIETLYVDRKDQPPYEARKHFGVIAGAIQFAIPGFTDGIAEMWSKGERGRLTENSFITVGRSTLKGSLDVGSWHLLAAISDTPLEFFALKLALNAATPIAIDLASVTVSKIKQFRSTAVLAA